MKLLLVFVVMAFPSIGRAAAFQYECTIRQVVSLDAGKANIRSDGYEVGRKFSVSRESGAMSGFIDWRRQEGSWKMYQVVDRGSKNQSFKLLLMPEPAPYTRIMYLEVKEFEQTPEKTFTYYDTFKLLTGMCL